MRALRSAGRRFYYYPGEQGATIIPNTIDAHAPEFKENQARMAALVDDLESKIAQIKLGISLLNCQLQP